MTQFGQLTKLCTPCRFDQPAYKVLSPCCYACVNWCSVHSWGFAGVWSGCHTVVHLRTRAAYACDACGGIVDVRDLVQEATRRSLRPEWRG